MIIKIFSCGQGSGSSPINYLFDEEKHQAYKPELIQGNANLTKNIIDGISNKHKYISGVIAFKDNEKLSQNQQLKLIDDFQKSFAPFDKQERVNFLWVRHQDKGNLEMHFICPRIDLKTKKAFNLHPPGQANKLFFQSFTRLQNIKYGFEQVDKIKLSQVQLKNTLNAFKDLFEKRQAYLVTSFDKSKKTPQSKVYAKSKRRITTNTQFNKELRKLNTSFKQSIAISKFSNSTNNANTIARTINDLGAGQGIRETTNQSNSTQHSIESIHRVMEFTKSAGAGFSKRNGSSPKTVQNTLGLSLEDEVRVLGMQLNDCDPVQAQSLIARLNQLQGQIDRLRVKIPRKIT